MINTTMKASVVPRSKKKPIEVQNVPMPVVENNTILVQVHYAPVTPTDIVATKDSTFLEKLFGFLIRPKGGIYGEMYTGVVSEVGADVTDVHVGDLVYGSNGMKLGTYAEYVTVKDTTLIRPIPSGVEERDVLSLLDGGITALPFLRDKGQIKAGQKILIIGASGAVGSAAVQIAKHYQTHVTGVCGPSNVDVLRTLGCDDIIDYSETDYTKQAATYDIIFDAVGKSSFTACKNILTDEGRYMTTVPTPGIMLKNLFVKNQKGKKALFAATGLRKVPEKMKDLEILEDLLQSKKLTPYIEKIYGLKDMEEAQKHVRSGHKRGNVLVRIN